MAIEFLVNAWHDPNWNGRAKWKHLLQLKRSSTAPFITPEYKTAAPWAGEHISHRKGLGGPAGTQKQGQKRTQSGLGAAKRGYTPREPKVDTKKASFVTGFAKTHCSAKKNFFKLALPG